MRTRLESERFLVSVRILVRNALRLLDEHFSTNEHLFGIDHVVDCVEEHGELVCASDQRQLELDLLLHQGEERLVPYEWYCNLCLLPAF